MRCPKCGSFKRVCTNEMELCRVCGYEFFTVIPGQKATKGESWWSWLWFPILLTLLSVCCAVAAVLVTAQG